MTGISNPHAFDADETAALDALGWRAGGGRCPDSALLLAVEEGALDPDVAARVREHVATCATCRLLVKDLGVVLAESDVEPASARIRARIEAATPRRARAPVWIGVAGLAAAAAIVWFLVANRTPPPLPESQTARVAVPPIPTVFVVDRPVIPVGDVDLTVRGEASTRVRLEDQIAVALDKADGGDLAAALSSLQALAQAHGNSRIAALALGAVQLRATQNTDAAATLERARSLKGDRATSDEAGWFLGIALVRTGNSDRARAILEEVCSHSGPRGSRGCDGVREIDRSRSAR